MENLTIENKVRIYACGGAGINIAKSYNKDKVDIVFVDSSTSNLASIGDSSKTYLLPDMDGAGKNRATTYGALEDGVDAIIIKHKPSNTLNIVQSSASGGTGSIIAPLLAQELIRRGFPVIVVAIGTTTSGIELRNTINTLHTYNNISAETGSPVAMYYAGNHKRSVVDKAVADLIDTLTLLTDKTRVTEFDKADLFNFINYNKVVPSVAPAITIIRHNENAEPTYIDLDAQNADMHVVSSILITTDPEEQIEGITPQYSATAVVVNETDLDETVRLDSTVGQIVGILSQLEKDYALLEDNLKASKIGSVKAKEGIKGTAIVL